MTVRGCSGQHGVKIGPPGIDPIFAIAALTDTFQNRTFPRSNVRANPMAMTVFHELLATHLINPGVAITGGGVRYGSVMYLGFGDTWTENHLGRREIRRFAAELELGADEWLCLVDGNAYLSSDRPDLSLERDDIDEMFVGGRLLNTSSKKEHFDLSISGGVTIRSLIKADQSSGFLLSLSLADKSYETIDGVTLAT